ncbi:hypothetical protein YSY43_33320 [Paenibacillus sp. YSY-4.3]
MPVRQILVCSSIFLVIMCGAVFHARHLSLLMSLEQSHLYLQQLNIGLRNPTAFQPREYIRIAPFSHSERFP